MITKRSMISLMCILMLTLCMQHAAFARRYRRPRPVRLTPVGQRLAVEYSAMLQSLRQKIINALPSINPGMKKRFMAAYRAETACKPYLLSPTWVYHVGESRALAARQLARARGSNKSYADALIHCQNAATPILDQINGFLSRDNLDAVLSKRRQPTRRGIPKNGGFYQHGIKVVSRKEAVNLV